MTPSTYRLINGTFQRFAKAAGVRMEKFADRALNQLQRNFLDAVTPLLVTPIAGGNRFVDVPFTSGVDYQLAHLLDRDYEGYLITGVRDSAARFIEIGPTASSPSDKFITLRADATCTADVYVF